MNELRAAGIDAVINLSEYPSDVVAFEAAGMEANWVPLPTDIPPTADSEMKCVTALPAALAFVASQMSRGRRTLVHCHAGKDRTGLLLAALIAKREGLSPEAAIRRVREVRPLAITASGWEAMARRVIARVLADMP